MASTHPFKDHIQSTALGDLQKTVQDKPFTLPPIGNNTQHLFVVFCIKCCVVNEILLQITIQLNIVKKLHWWLHGPVPGASERASGWSFYHCTAIVNVIEVFPFIFTEL